MDDALTENSMEEGRKYVYMYVGESVQAMFGKKISNR